MAGGRVLIVDDELHIRQILRLHLEAEGFQVQEAETGGEALAAVCRDRPDLIVLDLGLPDMSGLTVSEALAGEPPVPVIVLTALGDEDTACRGCIGVVTKPFSARDVLDRIIAALGREAA
jgi:DNA-binding response OmpR family regulator